MSDDDRQDVTIGAPPAAAGADPVGEDEEGEAAPEDEE